MNDIIDILHNIAPVRLISFYMYSTLLQLQGQLGLSQAKANLHMYITNQHATFSANVLGT